MAKKKAIRAAGRSKDADRSKRLVDSAVAIAEYAAQSLLAASQLRIRDRVVVGLALGPGERVTLAELPTVAPKVKKKLAKPDAGLTTAEVVGLTLALAELLPAAGPKEQVVLLRLAERLVGSVQAAIVQADQPAPRRRSEPS